MWTCEHKVQVIYNFGFAGVTPVYVTTPLLTPLCVVLPLGDGVTIQVRGVTRQGLEL